jgi:hypothetical protein
MGHSVPSGGNRLVFGRLMKHAGEIEPQCDGCIVKRDYANWGENYILAQPEEVKDEGCGN